MTDTLSPPSAAILLDVAANGVATLTLNRPEVRNAMDDAMRVDFIAALDQVSRDNAVKALVITGAGKGFCAGGDIRSMQQRAQAPVGEIAFNGWSRQQRTHQAVALLHALPKPTIAAVNGAAAGLGADLALACDFVAIAETANMAWTYVLRGLIPDGGGMYFLPRRVGLALAKELIYTGRRVESAEALKLGIASRSSPADRLLAEAQAWAAELGAHAGPALALAKGILDKSFELSAEEVFAQGSQAQAICYTTAEHRASIEAFLAKSSRPAEGRP